VHHPLDAVHRAVVRPALDHVRHDDALDAGEEGAHRVDLGLGARGYAYPIAGLQKGGDDVAPQEA
jgi:hypothetical protein